ncbi:MAG TPA: FAD-dependent oxidoreductase [Bryobacteraceae bacterium]|nr:FAD-dependent oxidoreductase [Bryobacteraceae bacterium]
MASPDFDLVILGAGSGGLTAAAFAAQLGAKVAIVEKNRIGGDCTWTGCVPSKALLKAAKIAHQARTASRFGIAGGQPVVDMTGVRDYVRQAIRKVYRFESPEELRRQGIEVIPGAAQFIDANAITAGESTFRSKAFLITTGAHARIPEIAGLRDVPFLTYEQIFDNATLPRAMIVVGGGPVGMELAQAYQRLGASVTVVAECLLPRDEPEVGQLLRQVMESEGVRFLDGRALSARREDGQIVVATGRDEARGDLLLVATGRSPCLAGLALEQAGVQYTDAGIPVDDQLRTNVRHIYAAGDVVGSYQFTHLAGWQAFQAARNALLPGSSSGRTEVLPWVTFTDPEASHVGLAEEQARAKFGDTVKARRWEMSRTDRAVCEDDEAGFLKIIARKDGTILGATAVNSRAGEIVAEFALAIRHNLKVGDLAAIIHPYPTYATAVQQLAGEMAVEELLSGASGKMIRRLSKIMR